MQAIIDTISLFFVWLKGIPDYVKGFYEYIICDSRNRAYEYVNPLIDKLPDLSTGFSSLSDSNVLTMPLEAQYAADLMQLKAGLIAITSAYTFRFFTRIILRRLFS